MPNFIKCDTKKFAKDISEDVRFNINANVTVVGSLKNYLFSPLKMAAEDTFSYCIKEVVHIDTYLSLSCTSEYQQRRSGFFKPKKDEVHREESQVSTFSSHQSKLRLSMCQNRVFDNPDLNILVVMPSNKEEYNQLREEYKVSTQYTHMLILAPVQPGHFEQELPHASIDLSPDSFLRFENSLMSFYEIAEVGNELLNIQAAQNLKATLERQFLKQASEPFVKKIEEEREQLFKAECEAECLSQVRAEADEFFNSCKCY